MSVWCFKPIEVPQHRDLHVVEPPIGDILSPSGNRTLVYPVSTTVSEVPSIESSGDDPGPSDHSGDVHRWRQRRGDPSTLNSDSQADATSAADVNAVREPILERQSPSVSRAARQACSVETGEPILDGRGSKVSRAAKRACSVETGGASSKEPALEPLRIDVAAAVAVATTSHEGVAWSPEAACSVSPSPVSPIQPEVEPVQVLGQDTAHEEETSPLKPPCLPLLDEPRPSLVSPTLMRFEVQAALVQGASPCLQNDELVSASALPTEDVSHASTHGQAECESLEDNTSMVWRSADEVLPVEADPDQAMPVMEGNAKTFMHVYGRRRQETAALDEGPSLQRTPPSPVKEFISKVSVPMQAALSTPAPVARQQRGQIGVVTETTASKPARC